MLIMIHTNGARGPWLLILSAMLLSIGAALLVFLD
jgi:hypothetical protein